MPSTVNLVCQCYYFLLVFFSHIWKPYFTLVTFEMILDDTGIMALQFQVNLFITFHDYIAPVYEYTFNFNVCALKMYEHCAQAHLNLQGREESMVQQVSTLCQMVI